MPLPYPTKVVLPFDIATAQDMNERHANDVALANGTGLDDGAVTPAKLSQSAWAASGTLNIGTTGIKTVTGLGFRPKVVEIIGLFNLSSAAVRTSVGGFDETSQWVALTTATTSNVLVSNDETRCLWAASVPAGSTQVSVTRNAITADGFSVNVATADSGIITKLKWIALA